MNVRWLGAVVLFVLLAGCVGGNSKNPSLYLLTPRAAPVEAAALTSISFGVGPVRVPPFLMRPQVVSHDGGGQLLLRDDQRWSEPLEQGMQRVLLQNLGALTGADMRNFPWTQTTVPHYALRVDVIDLDRRADGSTVLEAQWILEDIAAGKMLVSRRDRFSSATTASATTTNTTGDETDYTALAASYSDLLAQLAQRAADELNARVSSDKP